MKLPGAAFVLFLALLAFRQPVRAQQYGEIGLLSTQTLMTDGRYMRTVGAELFVPIDQRNHLTLNYHFGVGPWPQHGFYLHGTAGLVEGYRFMMADRWGWSRFAAPLGFVAMLVPEGVGYYVNPSAKWRAHLSLNPLDIDYWSKSDGDVAYEESRYSCELALRLKHNLKKQLYVAPHVNCKLIYGTRAFGAGLGVAIGYNTVDN